MEYAQELIDRALSLLKGNYCKMLFVNFTDDTFVPVVVPDDELEFMNGSNRISDYWSWFANSPLLLAADRERFLAFLETAAAGKDIFYYRKIDNAYRRVHLELLPGFGYSSGDKKCVLFVRDVDVMYSREYEEALEKIGYTDGFTGLFNKLAFERDCSRADGPVVGVAYIDLNGLKFVNDSKGHKAGDELILKLSALLSLNFGSCKCYHLSGDEFAVLSAGCNIRDFLARAIAFHKSMWTAMDTPIASIGYSVGAPVELPLVIAEAEREMYDDKRLFYSRFPEFKRK